MARGRKKSTLNIKKKPSPGTAYIVEEVLTGDYFKCSTVPHRDWEHHKLESGSNFSGEEPFFYATIGRIGKEEKLLKFLCGSHHKKCRDEGDKYEWLEIRAKHAKKNGIEFKKSADGKKSKLSNKVVNDLKEIIRKAQEVLANN